MTSPRGSRALRALLAGGVAAALGVAGLGATTAQATQPKSFDLTVLGTSDTHGNVLNWDYYRDAVFNDGTPTRATNVVGLATIATMVSDIRHEVGRQPHPRPGRRRHHPGHAAGDLLRQAGADHRDR